MAGTGEQGEGEAPAHVVVVWVEEPVAVPTARPEDDELIKMLNNLTTYIPSISYQ